jgi:26S proteasome regulatory subunit T6
MKAICQISNIDVFVQTEQGSYVGEVVKVMDKKKVLVKVHPEGKFVVDIDKNIDVAEITANCRVALRNDSYTLHKILPNKVDPLVSLEIFLKKKRNKLLC